MTSDNQEHRKLLIELLLLQEVLEELDKKYQKNLKMMGTQ